MLSKRRRPPVSYRGGTESSVKSKPKSSRTVCTAEPSKDSVLETLRELTDVEQKDRLKHVKSRLEFNFQNSQRQLQEVERLSRSRGSPRPLRAESDDDCDALSSTGGHLLFRSRLAVIRENSRESCGLSNIECPQICSKLSAGNCDARKVTFADNVMLDVVDPLPAYTAWTFVDRNERMTKDQSIALRRRISYESNGKETFFCPDTVDREKSVDEEDVENIGSLNRSQKNICRETVVRHGLGREVLETIANFLQLSVAKVESALPSEGYENKTSRCPPVLKREGLQAFRQSIHSNLRNNLQADSRTTELANINVRAEMEFRTSGKERNEDNDKCITLGWALEPFDKLFCRRCLVFNCPLHALSEETIVGIKERHLACVMPEPNDPKPCGSECRFLVATTSRPHRTTAALVPCASSPRSAPSPWNMSSSVAKAWKGINTGDHDGGRLPNSSGVKPAHIMPPDYSANSREKMAQCGINGEGNTKAISEGPVKGEPMALAVEDAESSSDSMAYNSERKNISYRVPDERLLSSLHSTVVATNAKPVAACPTNDADGVEEIGSSPSQPAVEWNRIEQDLCEKGVQIFGRDSCLIAQNMLRGCKSCREIAEYICEGDVAAASSNAKEATIADMSTEQGVSPRCVEVHTGRVFRSKSRFGRKKIASKSLLGAVRKRIGREGGELNACRQYTPCNCESRSGCGEDCPCVLGDMHCEKYCGCYKICKNRFRGCQCTKSMCEGRRCPCVAAGRECDPDLCKSCWIECGHSSPRDCHNMRILQRKKQRLLLASSDACTGWGIFTRFPLNKNTYIGEYTGELISHDEADRRGRIYDRETSFLFNLNDKHVVDAFRKGNKLKFANHSARKPNCYAKVLLVGGEQRVGIFAKDKIDAGEELLYDYQYEPDIAPPWATEAAD